MQISSPNPGIIVTSILKVTGDATSHFRGACYSLLCIWKLVQEKSGGISEFICSSANFLIHFFNIYLFIEYLFENLPFVVYCAKYWGNNKQ